MKALACAVFLTTGVEASAPSRPAGSLKGVGGLPESYDPSLHYYGYGIDIEKCIGCGRCVEACKTENNVSHVNFNTWVERYVMRKDGSMEVTSPEGGIHGFGAVANPETVEKSFFVPKMCAHCEHSPCEQVCPVGATFKTPDGVVLIDENYCIGCAYCIQACPYGCRYFDHEKGMAGKCSLCYHRITRGLQPACAEVCPTGARMFGDLKNPQSPVSRFLATHNVQVAKPGMHTRPKLYYYNLDKEVR